MLFLLLLSETVGHSWRHGEGEKERAKEWGVQRGKDLPPAPYSLPRSSRSDLVIPVEGRVPDSQDDHPALVFQSQVELTPRGVWIPRATCPAHRCGSSDECSSHCPDGFPSKHLSKQRALLAVGTKVRVQKFQIL